MALSYAHKGMPYFYIGARETYAALFFVTGHAYRTRKLEFHMRKASLVVGLTLVTAGACWLKTSMLEFVWWQVLPYGLVAVCGTLAAFYVAKLISQSDNWAKRLLVYVGDNTLTILTWHFLSFKMVSLVIIWTYGLPVNRLAEFPVIEEYSVKGWFVLYFLIGTMIPLGFSKIKFLK